MAQRKRGRSKLFLAGVLTFTVVFLIAFVGVQWLTKTGFFHVPGVVYYDESLNENELVVLSSIFTDELELDKDVKISAFDMLEKPELAEGEYLYNVLVPVTDYYSATNNITIDSLDSLTKETSQKEYNLINLADLDFRKKLLSINENYYLDDFQSGAVFRVLKFESEKFTEEILPLVDEEFSKNWPDQSQVLTMAQTGVTALSRGVNQKLASVGDATFFSAGIRDYLKSFDLTHTSNESSFSSTATRNNICSDPRFIDTLTDIGLDIVELTGNHNQDCGDEAAKSTIDIYQQNGIKIVGGGKTATEAAEPLEIDQKNNQITFLAYNLSTGGATLDNTPGANQYTEEDASGRISQAKKDGKTVIVDVQYYECSAYVSRQEDPTCDYANSAAGDQVGFFRHLIDLGADIVVGTSAHQPQTFELYGDGAIYYGLGNLFFDQAWWPGTTRSLILVHYFYDGKLLQTKIAPTAYDENYQTKLLDEEKSTWFLNRLKSARP